jgi:hypothetical protein
MDGIIGAIHGFVQCWMSLSGHALTTRELFSLRPSVKLREVHVMIAQAHALSSGPSGHFFAGCPAIIEMVFIGFSPHQLLPTHVRRSPHQRERLSNMHELTPPCRH